MTKEEILKPRYKVIADYPDSPFKVGDVLMLHPRSFKNPTSTQRWTTKPDLEECKVPILYGDIDKYPAILQPLRWWDHRQDAELPEYVKCIRTPDQKIMPGDVLKIREWFCGGCGRIENSDNIVVLNTDCYEPATIDEYKVKHHES